MDVDSDFESSDESDIEDIAVGKKGPIAGSSKKTKPSDKKGGKKRGRIEIEYEVENEPNPRLSSY